MKNRSRYHDSRQKVAGEGPSKEEGLNMVAGTPLAEWVASHVGAGRPFRSYREWALKAGLNETTIVLIAERGRATAETVAKMARAAGENPVQAFIAAGWLLPEEASTAAVTSTPDEEELLRLYRKAQPTLQRVVLAGLREGTVVPAR